MLPGEVGTDETAGPRGEERLFALWRLALTTGMRRGEFLGLPWVDARFDAKELRVFQTRVKSGEGVVYGRPKTEKGGTRSVLTRRR
ncbi:MAG TPA: hypothetical protein VG318_12695 [Actinomycetota bacterium]|nr:hypothetical protein [Actinomycetota bacterium]